MFILFPSLAYIILLSYCHLVEGSGAYFIKTKTAKKILLGDTKLVCSHEKSSREYFLLCPKRMYVY